MRTRKIIGAILCAIAFVFASGETIMNGVLAIVFLVPGIVLWASASTANDNVNVNEDYAYKKAA